ncbi:MULTISPECIES: class I SAM-dependent methyltransferase [Polaromonas]|uniref:Class I SAM-dependent methyltransferase n=1 Tax=Polaromonas aquatica TaxID=332657 RepID=A0ABW1U2L4_9BURK
MTITSKSFHCQICNEIRHHKVVYVVQGYPICKCEECGVGRADVEGFDPYRYYNNGYFTGKYEHSYVDYIGSKEILSREFSKTVEFIRSIGPTQGNLLEVGCAYGLFLQQAKQHYHIHGVELVEEAAAYCQANGLTKVKHGVLAKNDLEKIGTLDVAVMLDVIEHIDNVAETVGMISDHLRPGGSFTITTGDWASLVARITGQRWRLMAPPLHLWYFTPSSLAKLGQRFGLEVVSCSHPWKIVPLELILQQACTMLGIHAKISLPRLLKNLGLPVSLHDAMRIVFRKVE